MSLIEGRIELGDVVVDREMIDRDGRRAGKADDVMLELADRIDEPPRIVAIRAGPRALEPEVWGPFAWLARQLYRALGAADAGPIDIPWEKVRELGVAIRLDVDRREAGLTRLADAADRRYVDRLPGAGARE